MLLRRVMEHVKAQNWTAVGIDFVIVVVGVFVGLQVQEWAEERERGMIETAYTSRLHDEVVQLQTTRLPIVVQRHVFRDSLTTATSVLSGDIDRPLTPDECKSIAFSYVVSNPTDDLASLIELQSSGGLSLFQNEEVLSALRAFMLTRARARDSRAGIAESVIELSSAHPALIEVESFSVVAETPILGNFRCDVDKMRGSSSFINDYEINQSNFSFHVRDVGLVDQSLKGLHRVLDEVLSIKHEDAN